MVAQVTNEDLKRLFKQAHALTFILSNSGYMTERFKKGCMLLADNDGQNKNLLQLLSFQTEIYLALKEKETLEKRLLINYGLAFLALQRGAYRSVLSLLSHQRVIANHDLKSYASFSSAYDLEKDFKAALLACQQPEVIFWTELLFFMHYKALEDAAHLTNSQMCKEAHWI